MTYIRIPPLITDNFEIQTYGGQITVSPILSIPLSKRIWCEISSWQHWQSSVNSSKTWFKSCWLNLTSPSARFFSKSFVLALCSWMRASIFASDSLVNGRKVGRSSSVWNHCIHQKCWSKGSVRNDLTFPTLYSTLMMS